MKRKIELCMTLLLLIGMIVISSRLSRLTASEEVRETKQAVVIDAGHGGYDPGKIGVNKALEKDVNLQIAQRVKTHLEEKGIEVVMTREDDVMEETKLSDMKKRVRVINKTKPAIAVSIHQNSYTDSSVTGAQVFYYKGSESGKAAATLMREELKKAVGEHVREIKENDSFYMLKKTQAPTIIVECGFLSNAQEAEKLLSEDYQETLAEAVCEGIARWLEQTSGDGNLE